MNDMRKKRIFEHSFRVIKEIMDAIRTAGRIPAGFLYSILLEAGMSHAMWQDVEALIIETGLVRKENDLLVWTGNTGLKIN